MQEGAERRARILVSGAPASHSSRRNDNRQGNYGALRVHIARLNLYLCQSGPKRLGEGSESCSPVSNAYLC